MDKLEDANANLGAFLEKPPRVYIQNLGLASLPLLQAQYNPAELEQVLNVNWARLSPPGLSHQIMQYGYTENLKHSFELIYDAMDPAMTVDGLLQAVRFMHALCYSRRGAQNVNDGEACRVLFKWPDLVSLTCVVTSLRVKYTRFNKRAQPTYVHMNVSLEEIRDVRLFAEDVLDYGAERSSAPPVITGADQAADNGTRVG